MSVIPILFYFLVYMISFAADSPKDQPKVKKKKRLRRINRRVVAKSRNQKGVHQATPVEGVKEEKRALNGEQDIPSINRPRKRRFG